MNNHNDLIERLGVGVVSCGLHDDNETELFDVEGASDDMHEAAAIKELMSDNRVLIEDLRRTSEYGVATSKLALEWQAERRKAESERDELRKEVERLQSYVDRHYQLAEQACKSAEKAQALTAAIERETIERCAEKSAAGLALTDAGTYVDIVASIRSLPLTTDQSALDRIVDERTKELREALEQIKHAVQNGDLSQGIRLSIIAIITDAALSRTNGKDT